MIVSHLSLKIPHKKIFLRQLFETITQSDQRDFLTTLVVFLSIKALRNKFNNFATHLSRIYHSGVSFICIYISGAVTMINSFPYGIID